MSAAPSFARIVIAGIGLIGSSLALAIKAGGLAGHVVGLDADDRVREVATKLGIVDSVEADPAAAVRGADLVVLAVPVRAMGALVQAMAPGLAPGTIVTDTGSVKRAVIEAVSPHLPAGVHLVPGHPVAGTEHSGPEAGFAELFHDRWCILAPAEGADPAAVEAVARLWRAVGSDVEVMDPVHHDRVLAITSHLPHAIAYTIVATAADLENQLQLLAASADPQKVTTAEVIKYSAGGFRDFTRIAASDPVMWRDVFLTNREAVLEMLGRFTEDLIRLQRAIRWAEADTLEALFRRGREIRRGVVAARQAGRFVYGENGERKDAPVGE